MPILPAAHGTSFSIASSICGTGFVSLSSLVWLSIFLNFCLIRYSGCRILRKRHLFYDLCKLFSKLRTHPLFRFCTPRLISQMFQNQLFLFLSWLWEILFQWLNITRKKGHCSGNFFAHVALILFLANRYNPDIIHTTSWLIGPELFRRFRIRARNCTTKL